MNDGVPAEFERQRLIVVAREDGVDLIRFSRPQDRG